MTNGRKMYLRKQYISKNYKCQQFFRKIIKEKYDNIILVHQNESIALLFIKIKYDNIKIIRIIYTFVYIYAILTYVSIYYIYRIIPTILRSSIIF